MKINDPAQAELALALSQVFDSPDDRIVWDAGQGTAMSLGLGMARAARGRGRVVAVIGDRALAAGMAFEALNHGGAMRADLLVVLDDRHLSVDTDLGPLSHGVARALSGRLYRQLRESGKKMLSNMPTVRELARRSEQHLKGMVLPGTLFEEMGFDYLGPVNGHDVEALVRTLRNVVPLGGPRLLHVVNGRGAGEAAGAGIGTDGAYGAVADTGGSYAHVMGHWLCETAAADDRVVAVTAGPAAGLAQFAERFPTRCFDVPVAEQHAVTFAAGLATQGMRPVVVLDSALLQRGYDQVVHDVALQELPVVFDVATSRASFDISYLRCLPNVVIMAPADTTEYRPMLAAASAAAAPVFVRHAAVDGGMGVSESAAAFGAAVVPPVTLGRGEVRREGRSGLGLLVFGAPLSATLGVAEALDATLVNMRFVKPLDAELVAALAARHQALVTIEENAVAGGAGSAVGELLAALGVSVPRLHVGVPDRFIEAESRAAWLAAAGLDEAGLHAGIGTWWRTVSARRAAPPDEPAAVAEDAVALHVVAVDDSASRRSAGAV
jgi:1-deoxy-D-xylulose-5-phosphate synthase